MLQEDMNKLQNARVGIETQLRIVYGSTPRIYYGGSYGKKTLIRASFDLDIVIYFPSTDYRSLSTIYNSVHQTLREANYFVNPKNVALRLPYQDGFHIDVVPGRAQDEIFYYATLYKNEEGSTRQTSIKIHIDNVRQSNAREIIKLMKLWRLRHTLDWMSFAIELTVIRALAGQAVYDYGDAMTKVLQFIYNNILTVRLVDPANSNNILEMPLYLRMILQNQAHISLNSTYWKDIVW